MTTNKQNGHGHIHEWIQDSETGIYFCAICDSSMSKAEAGRDASCLTPIADKLFNNPKEQRDYWPEGCY